MISKISKIACDAGQLIHDRFSRLQEIKHAEKHDVKLQIDVDCQRFIESKLRHAFPNYSIVGEEESYGDPEAEYRWVVDPIDGTVNYNHGIPHFCVSIALQHRKLGDDLAQAMKGYTTVLGVVYDPMRQELFTAEQGNGAFLNEKPIRVSERAEIHQSILSVGFSKTDEAIERGLQNFEILVRRAQKLRNMGSAALDLAYVASGRLEAYLESKVRLWDIAAGILFVKEAGGHVQLRAVEGMSHAFETLASNGRLDFQSILSGEQKT